MGFSLGDIKRFLKSDAAASIARQALGIPGDGGEMPELPGPVINNLAPDIPPPVRTVTTNAQNPLIAPAAPNVPPPTRVEMDAPPPPGPLPGYVNQIENVNANLKMPMNLSEASGPIGNVEGAVFNPINPEIPAPTRTATAGPSPLEPTGPSPVPPPTRVFMGERTGNVDASGNVRAPLTESQKAAAHVRALQQDPSGQSAVRQTEEGYEAGPPQKMSRLKALGKMFLQRMSAGSQYGLGGMLGAGLVGAVEGGVDPGHAQKVIRTGEIARAQGEQANAQTLENRQIGNQQAQVNLEQDQQALIDAPRRRAQQDKEAASQEYNRDVDNLRQSTAQLNNVAAGSPEHAAGIQALQVEADRLSQKHGFKVSVIPGDGREPTRLSHNGEIVEFGGSGPKSVYGSPRTDDSAAKAEHEYTEKVGAATTKQRALQGEVEQAVKTVNDYRVKIDSASATATQARKDLDAAPAQVQDPNDADKKVANPALGALQRRFAEATAEQKRLQSAMEGAAANQRKLESDAASVYIPTPPPNRSKAPTVAGRSMSQSNLDRYAKDHNMTPEQALAGPLQGVVIR